MSQVAITGRTGVRTHNYLGRSAYGIEPEVRIPTAFIYDAGYERSVAKEAKFLKLPTWVIRRIDYLFGVSPYSGYPQSSLPLKEFFGIHRET